MLKSTKDGSMNTLKLTPATLIKASLALIIIVMGGYGYYRFFHTDSASEPIWLVVSLFVIIEFAILYMTTNAFSSTIRQQRSVSLGLGVAIIFMWIISTIGIDQTIWSMVESKYHQVKVDESSVVADKEREQYLLTKIASLQKEQGELTAQLTSLEEKQEKLQKVYDKKTRLLKDIIWYNGNNCNASVDCSDRKKVATDSLSLTKTELDSNAQSSSMIKEAIRQKQQDISSAQTEVEDIVSKRVAFEKQHRLALKNRDDEAIPHKWLLSVYNSFASEKVTSPERVYVLLLSAVVYPIYILLIIFLAHNTEEMKKIREITQSKHQKNTLLTQLLKKAIIYLIKTRKRKTVEVVKEVEVIQEVEKIVYKDGKEIVTVEIEVPHIIEKEVVVERTVEVPVIQKVLVAVPADVDLEKIDKLAKKGATPMSAERYSEANYNPANNLKASI